MGSLRPKEPLLAVMLSIILTGLGQVYAGRAVRGVVFFLVPFFAAILSFLYFINPTTSLSIYALVPVAGLVIFQICVIFDASRCTNSFNASNGLERKISSWKRTILLIGIIFSIPLDNFPFAAAVESALPYIKSNIVRAFEIPSGSMEPTIQRGDRVLVDRAIYRKSKPQRGDLIVFKYPLNPQGMFLKRLIAFEGETVEIKESHVYINGQLSLDPKIKGRSYGGYGQKPVTVSQDSYYVLDDNSFSSEDSRVFGFVPSKNVLGKVYKIYWPLNRSGKVE